MLLTDHGVFRLLYLNRHQVTPNFWRAAQPAPGDIRAAAEAGVRTIVNLRGGREYGSWPLEREACEAAGIKLEDFVVRSRGAPERETILDAKRFFDRLHYPVLVHCKSGADRAGFMAALYLLLHENRPLDEAMKQLGLRYGHFRFAKTGILDAFFERYRRDGARQEHAVPRMGRDGLRPRGAGARVQARSPVRPSSSTACSGASEAEFQVRLLGAGLAAGLQTVHARVDAPCRQQLVVRAALGDRVPCPARRSGPPPGRSRAGAR